MAQENKLDIIKQLRQLLHSQGKIVLAESVPTRAQKLSELLAAKLLAPSLYKHFCEAEAYLFNNPEDAMMNWDVPDLQRDFEKAGFTCQIETTAFSTEVLVILALLDRWLGEGGKYCDRLTHQGLSTSDIQHIRTHFAQQLKNQTVSWQRSIAFIQAGLPDTRDGTPDTKR